MRGADSISIMDRDFFSEPFSVEELHELFKSVNVKDYFSTRSPYFKKLKIELANLDHDEVLNLMFKEPRLIRRPLIFIEGHLIVGTYKSCIGNII